MKKTDERTPKSCSPTTGRKPKAFYISFYESVLKLNIMTTVAIIGDWKPVENNTFHYSVRETKVQNTMSGPVFPTQPCPGVCTLWCLIHLAQKHWKHWRCSRPMQGLHPLLLFRLDLKVSTLSAPVAATSKVTTMEKTTALKVSTLPSVPCLISLSLLTGTTAARRLQISWN